jgi:hypothetical protein
MPNVIILSVVVPKIMGLTPGIQPEACIKNIIGSYCTENEQIL